ncbi:hypothetical protein [Sphingomonas sp. CCH9-F2]|uniref:hypothetical protein n=1 Tax=Sphingomonas sp. CCH9-F2 TaxID=1768778 RepID=UPI0018D2620C|nr:hypothetical protein [Sphingomonas sp. CCH9-F2]
MYIATCASRDRMMRRALTALAGAGKAGKLRRAVRRYLASSSARTHAFARAFRRKHGPLSKLPDKDLIAIPLIAASTSAWRYSGGNPVAIPRPKRDGTSYRYIVQANVFQFAEELLAAAAVNAVSTPYATQFMSPRTGGRPKFEQWLGENMPTAARVVTIDIPRCFATIRHSSVADALPLPGKVMNEVFFKPRARTKYLKPALIGPLENKAHHAQASSSICGIAEGSALSSVAAELVLANVLRDVAAVGDAVRVASHGDNLIVLLADATSEGLVRQVLNASICLHFEANPDELAGRISSGPASQPFYFCGRWHRWSEGKLRIKIDPARKDEFVLRTHIAIEEARALNVAAARNKRVQRLRRSVLGWLHQYEGSADLLVEILDLWPLIPAEISTDKATEGDMK